MAAEGATQHEPDPESDPEPDPEDVPCTVVRAPPYFVVDGHSGPQGLRKRAAACAPASPVTSTVSHFSSKRSVASGMKRLARTRYCSATNATRGTTCGVSGLLSELCPKGAGSAPTAGLTTNHKPQTHLIPSLSHPIPSCCRHPSPTNVSSGRGLRNSMWSSIRMWSLPSKRALASSPA